MTRFFTYDRSRAAAKQDPCSKEPWSIHCQKPAPGKKSITFNAVRINCHTHLSFLFCRTCNTMHAVRRRVWGVVLGYCWAARSLHKDKESKKKSRSAPSNRGMPDEPRWALPQRHMSKSLVYQPHASATHLSSRQAPIQSAIF